jgi:hypothetical protein
LGKKLLLWEVLDDGSLARAVGSQLWRRNWKVWVEVLLK